MKQWIRSMPGFVLKNISSWKEMTAMSSSELLFSNVCFESTFFHKTKQDIVTATFISLLEKIRMFVWKGLVVSSRTISLEMQDSLSQENCLLKEQPSALWKCLADRHGNSILSKAPLTPAVLLMMKSLPSVILTSSVHGIKGRLLIWLYSWMPNELI